MIKALANLLGKPFPREESFADAVKITAALSLLLATFLYVLMPLGLHLVKQNYAWLCLSFGVTTFAVSVIYEWLVVYVFAFKRHGTAFTFGHWIVYFSVAMLLISVANFVLVRLVVIGHMDWRLFPYMIRGTFAVGLFPVVAVGAWALLSQERKYQSLANTINVTHTGSSTAAAERSADTEAALFTIAIERIRYIEAMQNYIKIVHLDESGQIREHVERATLKSLEQSCLNSGETSIVRCHRSYYVNRNAIEVTRGNAQGLLLELADCEKRTPVPVARRYVGAFR